MDYTLLGLSIVRQMHVFVLLLSTCVHIKGELRFILYCLSFIVRNEYNDYAVLKFILETMTG